MTTATRRRGLASAAAVTLLLLAGGCATGSGDSGDASSAGGEAAPAAEVVAPEARDDAGGAMSVDTSAADRAAGQAAGEQDQKLVSNGAVRLRSDDVGEALFDVRAVVDTYAGEVEGSSTETDDEGEALRARVTLRVPTPQFDAAMQDLERVGVLVSSSGNTEDVTTEVLDRDIRIKVQRRSIERIARLLEQATSIRDIVSIEAQLSQRQADLAVLEKEQRYLDDQTAMATINVAIERTKEKKKPRPAEQDESGFLAGLSDGWSGLKTFGEGLATVLGALLPWLVVAGVLAVPGLPLYRRLRRREAPTAAPSGA